MLHKMFALKHVHLVKRFSRWVSSSATNNDGAREAICYSISSKWDFPIVNEAQKYNFQIESGFVVSSFASRN